MKTTSMNESKLTPTTTDKMQEIALLAKEIDNRVLHYAAGYVEGAREALRMVSEKESA